MCIRDSLVGEVHAVARALEGLEVLDERQDRAPLAQHGDGVPDLLGNCLLYTSDAADERSSVDLGGRRIIKNKHKSNIISYALNTSTSDANQS